MRTLWEVNMPRSLSYCFEYPILIVLFLIYSFYINELLLCDTARQLESRSNRTKVLSTNK